MIRLETLISILLLLLFLHIFCFLLLRDFNKTSMWSKGNQVTKGHNKETFQSSSNESNKKHGELTSEKGDKSHVKTGIVFKHLC